MEKLTFNNEQLEFLKFIVQDFEYNDDHETVEIEEQKIPEQQLTLASVGLVVL